MYLWSYQVPPLYRWLRMLFKVNFRTHAEAQKEYVLYIVCVQINLKAVIFVSWYEWVHMGTGSPTGDKKSQSRPPCSTERRRIFVQPLGQPLRPRGQPPCFSSLSEGVTWQGHSSVCWSGHVYGASTEYPRATTASLSKTILTILCLSYK
jgi:hypothetical protein